MFTSALLSWLQVLTFQPSALTCFALIWSASDGSARPSRSASVRIVLRIPLYVLTSPSTTWQHTQAASLTRWSVRASVCCRDGEQGAVALTIGSAPHRTVFELRQFDWLFIFNNQWKRCNSGTILRGTDPTVSATAPWYLVFGELVHCVWWAGTLCFVSWYLVFRELTLCLVSW